MQKFVSGIGYVDETPEETQEREERELNHVAYVPPVKSRLYKSTFIRRLTASEATALETVLNEEEAYIRLLYQSVEWFDVADALVQYLHMTLEAAYGAERATALLEPEA